MVGVSIPNSRLRELTQSLTRQTAMLPGNSGGDSETFREQTAAFTADIRGTTKPILARRRQSVSGSAPRSPRRAGRVNCIIKHIGTFILQAGT
jgi:hypothetical protein